MGGIQTLSGSHPLGPPHYDFPSYGSGILNFEWRDNLFLFNAHQNNHEYQFRIRDFGLKGLGLVRVIMSVAIVVSVLEHWKSFHTNYNTVRY